VTKFELAAAIVVHNDRVLVVRRSGKESFLPNHWGIPCGKIDVEQGESAEAAVLRELHEETGLKGKIVKYVGRSEFTSPWHSEQAQNIQQNYLIKPIVSWPKLMSARRLKITTPQPDQQAEWVPLDLIDGFGLDAHNLGAINQWRSPG
jgi:ADP-ribose pyrophosphatase YjhB (NUDIX family)